MPKYAQWEITRIREIAKRTVSNEANTREGTLRSTILGYMNDADQTLQARLIADIPDLTFFHKQSEITLVPGTRDYAIPGDAFGGGIISMVEFSSTGETKNYSPVFSSSQLNLSSDTGGWGFEFDAFSGMLRLSPVPDTAQGKLRLSYLRATDSIDIRRGTISAVADNGTDYTSITLASDTVLESTGFADENYICVVRTDGSVVRYNLEYTSYNTGTRVLTLASGQAISGGTIAVNQYVVLGRYTRSHSQLPANCDRYRIHYAALAIQMQTSNVDSITQDPKVASIYDDIEISFRKLVRGPRKPPIINPLYT